MDFRTQYDRVRVTTKPGSMLKDNNVPVIDKQGNRVIEATDTPINLYAQIQSWRDECDINILMAKFTNGDKTALMKRAGAYGLDLSEVPDNFNDLMNLTTRAGAFFDSLPVDVKNMFGNNLYNFLANSKTKEFMEVMSRSEDDYRKEKVVHSKEFTKQNKEDGRIQYTENPGISLVDDGSYDPVPDPVEETRTYLNRSK